MPAGPDDVSGGWWVCAGWYLFHERVPLEIMRTSVSGVSCCGADMIMTAQIFSGPLFSSSSKWWGPGCGHVPGTSLWWLVVGVFVNHHFGQSFSSSPRWVVVCWLFVFGWVWAFLPDSSDRSFCGEFDPGSGRTLAACLTHASRTERPQLAGVLEWRTGE